MKPPISNVLKQSLSVAEERYDQVIRRWGNVSFAQSLVYDWVWSEEFKQICADLNDMEIGQIRLFIMQRFGVKPYPWAITVPLQKRPLSTEL